MKDLTTSGTAEIKEGEKTGYYYSASGDAITVEIKAGWTLRFLNLPSGTTYTIDETGFPDGFAFDEAEGRTKVDTSAQQDDPEEPEIEGSTASGTINVPNVEFYVDYTNKYEEIDIQFTKTWDDADDKDGIRPDTEKFADYLSLLVNDTASTAYDENRTITDNNNGTYTIKYTGVPKYINGEEAVYKLQESKVDGYDNPVGSPAVVNGNITNTHTPVTYDVTLEVTKALADGSTWPTGKTLTFTLSGEGGTLPETKTVELTEPGTATFGAITYDLDDAGKTYTYTITEDGFGDGWTGDPESITATVEVGEDTGTGTLSTTVTYDPTDKTITNTYEPLPTSVQLKGTKVLEGRDLKDGEFTFVLSDAEGNTTTVTNDASGNIDFGTIEYKEAGTYVYVAKEVEGTDSTVTYDTESKTFTVEVTDEGGHLVAKVTCGDGDTAQFTNKCEKVIPPSPTPVTGDMLPMIGIVLIACAAAAIAGVSFFRMRRRNEAAEYAARARHMK